MANSDSFNKRQVEKQKRAKRKEKQKKREERKNNPKSSFDDMIAYVDENGVITCTPPENTKPEGSGNAGSGVLNSKTSN